MSKPMIIKCGLIRKGYCLNVFGTLWARDTSWINKYVINHERIHTAQQKELLFIPFYILYGIEWIFRLIQYRNIDDAYMNISFEREAYTHGGDLSYLPHRKLYSWIKFLRKRK